MTTTQPHPMIIQAEHLRQQFAELRAQGMRSREVAKQLGVSEGECMAAHAVSQMSPRQEADSLYSVTVLDGDWKAILQGLEGVGPVMALTRNEAVVHEKIGVYRNVSQQGMVGMALGPEIDLRLFFAQWHVGMHVVEHDPKGDSHSLQFFDVQGQAVHKVHARAGSDIQALETLVQQHARPEARPVFTPQPMADTPVDAGRGVDVEGLDQAWSALRDTHEFFDLLRRFEVSRLQSMRLMTGRHTLPVPQAAVSALLHQAAAQALPIMVFAGNQGCLQIHTGVVHRVEAMGPWLNVLDEGFNLHLRTDLVAECWLVSKPTVDGVVTSLEVFDTQGQLMCMFFGERKPGQPERPAWRALAHSLAEPVPVGANRQHSEVLA